MDIIAGGHKEANENQGWCWVPISDVKNFKRSVTQSHETVRKGTGGLRNNQIPFLDSLSLGGQETESCDKGLLKNIMADMVSFT